MRYTEYMMLYTYVIYECIQIYTYIYIYIYGYIDIYIYISAHLDPDVQKGLITSKDGKTSTVRTQATPGLLLRNRDNGE